MNQAGILVISQGDSRLRNGPVLARQGGSDPFGDATAFIRNQGFDDGDSVTVLGTSGQVGEVSVLFIVSIAAASVGFAAEARVSPREGTKRPRVKRRKAPSGGLR